MGERALKEDLREGQEKDRQTDRDSVGTMLARARRASGQEVVDVAANLRIRRVYLQAIEEGRYGDLPGTTYAVGFVRSYAEHLDLDSEFLVERFKAEIAGLESQQRLHFPAPKPEGKLPGGALVIISVLLIALSYGGWYYANQNNLFDELLRQQPTAEVPDAPSPEPDPRNLAAGGATDDQTSADAGEAQDPDEAQGPDELQIAADAQSEPTVSEEEAAPVLRTPPPPLVTSTQGPRLQRDEAGSPDEALPEAETAALPPQPEDAATATAEPAGEAAAEAAPLAPAVSAGSASPEVAAASDAAEPAEAARVVEAPTAEAPGGEAAATAALPTEIAAVATETMEPDIPAAPDLPSTVGEGAGRVYGAGNAESRITLTATSDSWVQVRSAEDNLLITRVLRAGDVYRVPNQEGLTLETGNAGGLEVMVDGQTAPALGRPGDVLRGISLEPQALLSGRASP